MLEGSEEREGWRRETYDRNTVLINPSIGINVVFVRLLASENKKEVAADTGVVKFSYSSVEVDSILYFEFT